MIITSNLNKPDCNKTSHIVMTKSILANFTVCFCYLALQLNDVSFYFIWSVKNLGFSLTCIRTLRTHKTSPVLGKVICYNFELFRNTVMDKNTIKSTLWPQDMEVLYLAFFGHWKCCLNLLCCFSSYYFDSYHSNLSKV